MEVEHPALLTFGVADGKFAVATPMLGVRGLRRLTVDTTDD